MNKLIVENKSCSNKFLKIICCFVNVSFLLFSSMLFIVGVEKLLQTYVIKDFILFSIVLLSLLFALFVFLRPIMTILYPLISGIKKISVLKLAIFIFLIVSITKIILVFFLDNDYTTHEDMRNYLSFAKQIADNGQINEEAGYAYNYPYTVVFSVFLSPIVKIFGSNPKVITVFLSVLYAVVSVLSFDIIRKFTGVMVAFWGIILFNISPFALLITQVVFHETALLFFYVLSFWLLLKSHSVRYINPSKYIFVLLSAITISLGSKMNVGGLVIIISMLIFEFIFVFKNGFSVRKICDFSVRFISFVLCFLIVSLTVTSLVNGVIGDNISQKDINKMNNSVSLGWGVFLGTNYEVGGFWNKEDYDTYYKYADIDDTNEAKQYQLDLINKRLDYLKQSPILVVRHLHHKLRNLWGEPVLYTRNVKKGINNNGIADAIFGFHNEIVKKIIYQLSLLLFIVELFIIIFSFRKKTIIDNHDCPWLIYQFKLAVMGLTVVLCLFEIHPKYVSHMQFILFVICLMSIKDFLYNSEKFRCWIRKKLKRGE